MSNETKKSVELIAKLPKTVVAEICPLEFIT
jgi:hypothetical protein